MELKDRFLLQTIVGYCDEISASVEKYQIDEEKVFNDSSARAVLAFFVQQIGETANHLSASFKEGHQEIEWKAIVGFRHRIVHAYGKVLPDILWSTVQKNIPELRKFCTRELEATGQELK